jgi:hypothetical protein
MMNAILALKNKGFARQLDRLCRWAVALVFVVAAVPKLLAPLDFAEMIAAYGLLPDILVVPVAFVLPPLEILLAYGLVRSRPAALWVSLGLLVFFILFLGYAVALGLDIDCGCFGPGDPEQEAFSGLREAIVRDLVLGGLLAYSLVFSKTVNFTRGVKNA